MGGAKRLRSDAGFADVFSTIPEDMQQNSLVQQFEALGPDVGLRLANLRNLVSSLTPQETRFLRLHLQSLPTSADIVSQFPTDILVEVSPYLCGSDIFNILNVSKAWRKAWSQRDVVRALAKHHIPNFLQFYAHRNTLQSSEDTDQGVLNSLYQAARKFSIRQQGLFQSTISNPAPWLHPLTRDRFFTLEPTNLVKDWDDIFPGGGFSSHVPDRIPTETDVLKPWSSFEYCNGKVAWMPVSSDDNLASLTFVDDLRTQQRRVYKLPISPVLHGSPAWLENLGNELVVVSLGRSCHAWDLETSEHDCVILPSLGIYQVRTKGKRAYILTENSEVYVWKFKRDIRVVDTSSAGEDGIGRVLGAEFGEILQEAERKNGILSILPHPLLDDTFYLLSLKEESEIKLVVHEFNHNGTLRLHTTTLPAADSLTREWGTGDFDIIFRHSLLVRNDEVFKWPPFDYFRTCEHTVDQYGNYAICQFFVKGRLPKYKESYEDEDKYYAAYHKDDDICLGYTVLFNALTASVSTSPFIHNIAHDGQYPPSSTCWGGQQIEIISAPTKRDDLRFCMLLVSELNSPKRLEAMDALPVYCPSSLNSLKEFIPVNHRVTECLANTPAKLGKMMSSYNGSNIVSQYLTERVEVMPSIQPVYGLDITFDYDRLRDHTYDDDETFDDDDNAFTLIADEDFLVCLGPRGYVAWNFYHDMRDRNATA